MLGNALHRYRTFERHLLSQIDLAHRSATKQRVDANATKNNARLQHDGERYEPLSFRKVRPGRMWSAVSPKVTRTRSAADIFGMMIG